MHKGTLRPANIADLSTKLADGREREFDSFSALILEMIP